MIHQDAHLGNLFVDDNYTLTLFDFDDCVYGHFIYDIAMVLFYSAGWGRMTSPVSLVVSCRFSCRATGSTISLIRIGWLKYRIS